MAIDIPSMSDITRAWTAGAGAGATRYREGVSRSGVDWEGPTKNAEQAWQQGVQEAAAAGRFGTGVDAAGNEKWRRRSIELGSARFASGIAAAASDYSSGFAPFRDVIAGLTLPPRGPRGSAGNLQRVAIITEALHQRRIQG